MLIETRKGTYQVYSSREEFVEDNNELELITEIPYAAAGNYIESEQGYIIPVIARVKLNRGTYLQLPLFHVNINEYWERTNKGKVWYPAIVKNEEEITFDGLSSEHKAIARLVGNGMSLGQAIFVVYGRNVTLDLFSNDLLCKYLGKHLNMNKWKEALEAHSVNENLMVQQLAEMATNNDPKAQHGRIYAIERLSALIEKADANYGTAEVIPAKEPKGYFKPLAMTELPVYADQNEKSSESFVEAHEILEDE